MSYYAGGAAGSWGAGVAFEGAGWTGSVITIALVQALAAAMVMTVWRQKVPN